MELTVLCDNTSGAYMLAEHGLSFFIEHNGCNILLDAGSSDVFLKNAGKLGIDIKNDTDIVVLSHGHWDHGDGLRFIDKKPLITHPKSFMKRYRAKDDSNIGLMLSKEELSAKFELQLTDKPKEIFGGVYFLGEIPRLNDFESKSTTFVDENGEPDFVADDSALAFVDNDELVVVTGCSHSGICNIIDYAQKVTSVEKVRTVIGGFHLKKNNEQAQKTVEYLKSLKIKNIYPNHCTDLPALSVLYSAFKFAQVKTGMKLKL